MFLLPQAVQDLRKVKEATLEKARVRKVIVAWYYRCGLKSSNHFIKGNQYN